MYYRKSELITWSNTFSCGIKLIDDQHRELVTMVNDMFLHVTGSEKEETNYFSEIVQKVIEYIKTHFSTEEKIMKTTGFEGYLHHKHIHDSFILSIHETIEENESGKHVSHYTFTKYLKDWIFSHIAVMDKQYFEYFKQIASRKDNGKLGISLNDMISARSA